MNCNNKLHYQIKILFLLLNMFLIQQEQVISSLATNPVEFSQKLYTIRPQLNSKLFGPDHITSPFSAFNNSNLCDLISSYLKSNNPVRQDTTMDVKTTIEDELHLVKVMALRAANDFFVEVKLSCKGKLCERNERSEWSEVKLSKTSFIASDQFTHSTLISFLMNWYLNNIAPGLKTLWNVKSTSICSIPTPGVMGPRNQRYGVQLFDDCDLGTLNNISSLQNFLTKTRLNSPLPDSNGQERLSFDRTETVRYDLEVDRMVVKPDIIFSIVKQILITLNILQESLLFNHGHLITSNIGLKSSPVKLSSACLNIDDQFTCKIGNFDSSAISVNFNGKVYRMYQRSPVYDWISIALPFTHVQNTKLLTEQISIYGTNIFYTIPVGLAAYQYERYLKTEMNVPNRQFPTFDTYTFIISFLLIPEVFYSVFSNEKLMRIIWLPLFTNEDRENIYLRLLNMINNYEEPSFERIFKLLQGVNLKYTITIDILQKIIDTKF